MSEIKRGTRGVGSEPEVTTMMVSAVEALIPKLEKRFQQILGIVSEIPEEGTSRHSWHS